MSKFKVGDKVRIVSKNSVCLHGFNIDDICEIVRIDEADGVYPYHILNLCVEERLGGWAGEDDIELLPTFEYIYDTMDTSKRIVVDFNNNEDDCVDACRYCYELWEDKYKNKEEKDMNKVLNLWCKRQRDKIVYAYKEKEVEFYNNKYSIVESFNELVEKFNNDLEDLYKMDKTTEQFVLTENAPNNVIKYCLDLDKLKEEFEVEYLIKRNEELGAIEKVKEEVEAQLSLSNDLEYQQEVLIRYGIIDKKTKKIAD